MTENPTVVQALSKVMETVQTVRKDGRNQQQGYSFRGIDAVVNAVGPALRTHGVVVVPLVEDVQYALVEVGQKRTPMRECTVRVRYRFHGPAGDVVECVSIGEAMDSGDKSTPKAMSVAFRVALLQALCIPTDEPDADAAAYERAPRESWEQAAKPPTDAQIGEFNGLMTSLDEAGSVEEIGNLGVRVKGLHATGGITPVQYDALSRRAAAKLAELRAEQGDEK